VDADLPEAPDTRAYELVWRPARNDDDLSRRSLERLLAEGEAHLPIQDYERLFVRVAVQARSRAGSVAVDKERDARPILVAVEPGGILTARESLDVDHVLASIASHRVSLTVTRHHLLSIVCLRRHSKLPVTVCQRRQTKSSRDF
jgi:hypothetical protein